MSKTSAELRERYVCCGGADGCFAECGCDEKVVTLCNEYEALEKENARLQMIVDSWQASKNAEVTIWPK